MQINRFIRAGTLVKNSAYVLVLILRLRQLCCHPNLILVRSRHLSAIDLLLIGTLGPSGRRRGRYGDDVD